MSSLTFQNIIISTFILYLLVFTVATKAHEDEELMKQEFLDAHNKIREHMGEPPLNWDEELAKCAQNWANALSGDCNMIHSYGPYGENLFWGGYDHWTPTEVVQSWASESQYFDDKGNTCSEGQMCGHYTQVIWRKTCRIGCARQKCNNGGLIVVCNYDPPGNYEHENPLYETN
ncbi:hypothetical protein Pint_35521 [Pistacia integerrima]|uniref:Uncharacterized protein n=1 Tax=Pistacia integerrima TaxID=434235 RepID=A0ACC0Y4W6_9ROSI|nr:hypothetical protein Pint_35521 [Pistacia integerrima]